MGTKNKLRKEVKAKLLVEKRILGPLKLYISGNFMSWDNLEINGGNVNSAHLPGEGFLVGFRDEAEAKAFREDAQVFTLERVLTEDEKRKIEEAVENDKRKTNSKSKRSPRKVVSRPTSNKSKSGRVKSKPVHRSSNKKRGK